MLILELQKCMSGMLHYIHGSSVLTFGEKCCTSFLFNVCCVTAIACFNNVDLVCLAIDNMVGKSGSVCPMSAV